jgi:3-dehydroquinate dehydratase-2
MSKNAPKVLLLNGPNLNLLGKREPDTYGKETLTSIEQSLQLEATALGISLEAFQSNHEGELVDRIHQAKTDNIEAIVFNPGAFTHTSVAIRDALLGVSIPFIEVHISNTHAREDFRHHSYLSDIAAGVITGLGTEGYSLALQACKKLINIPQS